MPWFASLFQEKVVVKEGYIDIPERVGVGFSFDEDMIKKYLIS